MDAVPLRHGLEGRCDAAVRPLDGADALAVAEARAVSPPAALATALLARVVTRIGEVAPLASTQLRALTAPDRERLLLALYASTFGPRLELVARCPSCRELTELDLPPADLLNPGAPGPRETTLADGLRVRLPTGADQEAAAREPERAAAVLVERCVRAHNGSPVAPALVQAHTPAIDSALRSLDPLAAGELDFPCPACAAPVPARLDALSLVLARLPSEEALDSGTLALARAYGWREPDIQALPLPRRARYLAQAQTLAQAQALAHAQAA